jgi:transposase
MSNRRLSVRKIKEILRLKLDSGISEREISRSCGISRSTVADYLRRAAAARLSWPEAALLSESELEGRLFPTEHIPRTVQRPLPDCEHIYNELRTYRKLNLTLSQLWLEYKEQHPDGYQYTQFCEHYWRWRQKLDYSMRQEHRGGEKLFIDYADGLSIVDRETGEIIVTQLFLAVWGASNYTYAEAARSQTLPEWMGAHQRAFEYFDCAPHVLVPDNLKSGVSRACKYEPDINPTYSDMAGHYGCAVLPARPRKPRDKAKVENGVLIAKRWILAVLRHRTFYSLAELNTAIREQLEHLNNRPLRVVKKSRRELFETLDRPQALSLPARPYEYAEWYKARVQINYHIDIDRHHYSMPYQLLHERLDIRLTASVLEAYFEGKRVAAHIRQFTPGGYTTLPEHMPPSHRFYAEWNPARFIQWAGKIGEATARLVERILATRPYPQQGYKSCLGIINLTRDYEPTRVEAAAKRALKYKTCSYRSMRSILEAKLDRQPEHPGDIGRQQRLPGLLPHHNIRGPQYYQ